MELRSILLVDDNQESLDLYSDLLMKKTNAIIKCIQYPSEAIKLANKHFYDIILIDVTMNYNITQFGGLEVYKSLKDRYGDSSLVVYSQFITDDLLRSYDYSFNFILKKEDPGKFIDETLSLMQKLRKRQSCFVAMPFASAYNNVYHVIKKSIQNTSYQCVRIDEQHFTNSIVETIFQEIKQSKLVVFLASDKNPNAFYECGFAVALNKEVITITDVFENLPFDIRDRSALAFGDNLEKLQDLLMAKLNNLTHMAVH